MLREIAQRYHLELKGVPAIGDSLRDLEAAAAVGARPILVLTGKGRKTAEAGGLPDGTKVCADLAGAVADLLAQPV
jgi:D-glycero-D-manno-heptose 1,7-bisphosphate phosphatase